MNSEKNFDRMVAHYDLNPAQIEFAESCISSLSRHDKEFKGGAKSYTGCGCIASTLATSGASVDYQKMSRAFGSVVKFSETDETKSVDVVGLMKDLTETHGMSYGETMTVVAELGQATEACKSARLPKQTATKIAAGSSSTQPYQPTVIDAPSGSKGCDGLSPESVATLQKIAERDGKSLEQMCANVVS